MSVEAITWALKQPIKPSSTKFVLVVLANCASGDTFLAYPSTAYLTEATGQDRKTVIGNLDKLAAWSLIEDTGKRAGLTKQIVVWRLMCSGDLFGEGAQKREAPKNGTVPKTAAKAPEIPAEGSQKRDTETSGTVRNREAKASAPAALDFSSWPATPNPQVLADWLAVRKVKRAPVTETVMKSMGEQLHRALARGYSVDEALEVSCRRNWQGFEADWLEPKTNGLVPVAGDSKTLTGMKALQGMKPHGLVHERDYRRAHEADVLELGSDACRRLGADHGCDVD